MSDKTDIQALTEQMQSLNKNMQAISEKLDKVVDQAVTNPMSAVIRSSAENAKSNSIIAGIVAFIFIALIMTGITHALGLTNVIVATILVITGAATSAFYIAKWSYRYSLANPRKYLATDARYTVAGANSCNH
jgi:hypothetical protein